MSDEQNDVSLIMDLAKALGELAAEQRALNARFDLMMTDLSRFAKAAELDSQRQADEAATAKVDKEVTSTRSTTIWGVVSALGVAAAGAIVAAVQHYLGSP